MTRQRIMHRQPAGSRAKEVTKDASDMSARRAARGPYQQAHPSRSLTSAHTAAESDPQRSGPGAGVS